VAHADIFKQAWLVAVIIETRYGGVYEGGPWAAFGVDDPKQVPDEALGGDPVAAGWWGSPTVPVGVGDSPDEALDRLRFLTDRDRRSEETGFFEVGAEVRVASSTPDCWYGEGIGVVRSYEFRAALPYVGGLRGQCVYTVDFADSEGVRVPEAYLRPAS
jgi:hypothetical protein